MAGALLAPRSLPAGQAAAVGGLWLCRVRPWGLVAVVVPSACSAVWLVAP